MPKSRAALLTVSTLVVVILMGGGLGLKVGAATEGGYAQARLFSEIYSLVLENYVDSVDTGDLLAGAYEGMLGGLDAHGAYLEPDEVALWKDAAARGSADPGIDGVKQFGNLRVVWVEPGSPAAEAGIVAGDHIRSIAGAAVRDMSLDQALLLLRGRPGTTVKLGLMHPAADFEREDVVVGRAVRRSLGWDLEVLDRVAVLSIHDLDRIAPGELAEALKDLRRSDADSLLVDLRDVVETDARGALPLLRVLGSDSALLLKGRRGQLLETLSAEAGPPAWSGPLDLLVNGQTAGGAEAAALALHERRGARVFGETTYGLGAEPRLFELEDGAGVLVSAAFWQTGDGGVWNESGLEPDETIVGQGDELAASRGDQLRRALEAIHAERSGDEAREAA